MITNENISQFSVVSHIAGILIIERSTLIDLRELIKMNCNASIGLRCSASSFFCLFVCLKASFSLTASNQTKGTVHSKNEVSTIFLFHGGREFHPVDAYSSHVFKPNAARVMSS